MCALLTRPIMSTLTAAGSMQTTLHLTDDIVQSFASTGGVLGHARGLAAADNQLPAAINPFALQAMRVLVLGRH